jgi:photosystem II stability/assembly factor-like uncharacterized protein
VYASGQTGLYRSDDAGAHWRILGGAPSSIGPVAVDPVHSEIVYGGTSGDGVVKSTDGGHSWLRTGGMSTNYGSYVDAIVIDPKAPDVLYAATLDGVWKSEDGGCSWVPRNAGLPISNDIFYTDTIAMDPTDPSVLYLGTLFNGMYRSADGAASWSPASSGLPYETINSIAIDPGLPSRIFAVNTHFIIDLGGGDGTIVESQDSGQTWQPAGTGLPNGLYAEVIIDPGAPGSLWTTLSGTGVLRSMDGGATWTPASAGLDDLTGGPIVLLPGGVPRLLVGAGFAALEKSDDGGGSWQPSRDGLRLGEWHLLAGAPSAPSVLYAGAYGTRGGVARSSDAGQSWQGPGSGLVPGAVVLGLAVDPTNASVAYVSLVADAPNTFKTIDGGASWAPASGGLSGGSIYALAVDPSNPLHVFAAANPNFYISFDGGTSWTPAPGPVVPINQIVFTGAGTLFGRGYQSSTMTDRPYVSTDGGDSWTLTDTGLPANGVVTLAADPSNASVLYAATPSDGLFHSTDGGGSWSAFGSLSGYAISAIVVDPSDPTDLFVGTTGNIAGPGGVLRSRDGGATWTPLTKGLDDFSSLTVLSLELTLPGPFLHAGTLAGIFENRLSDASGPVPAGISPASGPRSGGTAAALAGTGFLPGAQVFVGGAPAASIDVVDPGTIDFTTPAGSPGAADVVVQNPDGQLEALPRAFVFDYDDVPPDADYHDDVVKLTLAGAAVGCGNGQFCPDVPITRAQMAVLLERTLHGPDFAYPPPTASFVDVLLCSPEGRYILQMAGESLTVGCGPDHFCPDAGNTRAQAAVFVIKAEHGAGYTPPAATGAVFSDVPADAFAADYIEQLALEGITAGCGGGQFCPYASVTRGQAAVFLSRALLTP